MARRKDSDHDSSDLEPREHAHSELVPGADTEPPVVARMIVEIRSDGTRTIARGAMEDLTSGEKVAIEAHGRTPMGLALGLAKSMMGGRALARAAARKLLPGPKKRK